MKKITLQLFALIAIASLMTSCVVMAPAKSTKQAARFTTVDKIISLKAGMTYTKVVSTLGSPPYDVHHISFDKKETVYVWYYKKIERLEDPNLMKTKAGASSGQEVITTRKSKIYVTFDDDKKLLQASTDAGLGKASVKTTFGSPGTPAAAPKPFWKIW